MGLASEIRTRRSVAPVASQRMRASIGLVVAIALALHRRRSQAGPAL
jgi:hypothetical protein